MDEKELVESLSPIEKNTLPNIKKDILLDDLAKKSGQDKTTTLRALNFLKNKGLVDLSESQKKQVIPGILGINYLKKKLPERALLDSLAEKKSILLGEIKNTCNLNDNESKVAIGILKKKALVEISKGRVNLNASLDEISKKSLEENLLESLPRNIEELEPQEKLALENLKSRKDLIEIEDIKIVTINLTNLGNSISKENLKEELLENLTPKILKQGSWKGKKFRRYDIESPVPKIYGGKRHFVNQAIDDAKSIWLEMGFREMRGSLSETGFWVFDTLFTAQDHPVREMQDTFFIKNIVGDLPKVNSKNKENIVEMTKKAHEGELKGSLGWQYKWDENDSKKVLLRTHTTCLSTRKLYEISKTKEFPAKYFSIGKVFRNETVDWSHGFEFNQSEGIVVDENANFRQLLGYLIQFFKKMGYEKLRIRPAYFAYTEPSLEMDVFHPVHKKWVELGAAGMFRPEVTIPIFGRHIPVLAWGPGFDRMITQFYEIHDLRELYKNDITKLRETKFYR